MPGPRGHAEIAHSHTHAITLAYHQMVDAREHTAVPGPQIEVGHGVDLGHVTSCIDVVGADEKDEIAIDPHEFRITRMNDERAHHAHCHLHHLIGMWVVHEGAALLQHELVDKGLARFDLRLGQPADAIHAARQQHAVPMDRGVLGQSVGDEEADLIAFDRLDRRPRRLAVVALSLPPKTEPLSLCQWEGLAWLGSGIRTRSV
jgi:hypothetical protein